jgi:uncharacterized membrane protein YeaQ/YmgE (transglycosylase-associated protein family)
VPELGILGWIIIGGLAGLIAGALVPGREPFGCLGTILVGIGGGLLGGWLWTGPLGQDDATGWLGALVLAIIGAVIVLLVLRAIAGRRA